MTLEEITNLLKQLPPSGKTFKSARHCGVLVLSEEPLSYQKRTRDEWA